MTCCCENDPLRTNSTPTVQSHFPGCRKLLPWLTHSQYLCATCLSVTHESPQTNRIPPHRLAPSNPRDASGSFARKLPAAVGDRPELHRLLDQLRKADVLVVWKLDRLSRSLRDVLTIMEHIAKAKAEFRSLSEAIDTTSPAGRMMMQMLGAFAEYERAMLRERTKAGLA